MLTCRKLKNHRKKKKPVMEAELHLRSRGGSHEQVATPFHKAVIHLAGKEGKGKGRSLFKNVF